MKYLLFITAIITIQFSNAQTYVTDTDVEELLITNDDEVKILYFTATWCGPCKYMSPIMKSLDKNKTLNLTVYKMDIDKNETDDFLNVNSVPTYFYFKNGVKLGSSSGAKRKYVIKKMVEKYQNETPTGEPFMITPTPSNYEITAGAHPELSVTNLKIIWHDASNLRLIARNIVEQLDQKEDFDCGLALINRSLELESNPKSYSIKARLHHSLDDTPNAKKAARMALKMMDKTDEDVALIKAFLEKL